VAKPLIKKVEKEEGDVIMNININGKKRNNKIQSKDLEKKVKVEDPSKGRKRIKFDLSQNQTRGNLSLY
jgi:hypothetical protein